MRYLIRSKPDAIFLPTEAKPLYAMQISGKNRPLLRFHQPLAEIYPDEHSHYSKSVLYGLLMLHFSKQSAEPRTLPLPTGGIFDPAALISWNNGFCPKAA
jgi:hypothetical protein